MSFQLKTVDQVPGAPTVEGPRLTFRVGRVTLREIVRARVRIEVDCHNANLEPRSRIGLIETPRVEQELNGPRREQPRPPLAIESQVDAALDAVRKGRVIVLFNGEQVSDLDAPLLVTPVSEARFLRLVPLVGG